MNPDLAYEWIRSRILKQGALKQAEAAQYLLQFADERLAYFDEFGGLCVGRPVLRLLRRRSPELRYDRAEKCWCLTQSGNQKQRGERECAA